MPYWCVVALPRSLLLRLKVKANTCLPYRLIIWQVTNYRFMVAKWGYRNAKLLIDILLIDSLALYISVRGEDHHPIDKKWQSGEH